MAISIDGVNTEIVLSVDYIFDFRTIYVELMDWSAHAENMKYLLPCEGQGKSPLGGGVFTDSVYKLLSGWKLKPSGYVEGDQISIIGTVITADGSPRTKPQTVGDCPIWVFTVSSNGIIANVGSGLTTEEHDMLYRNSSIQTNTNLIPGLF